MMRAWIAVLALSVLCASCATRKPLYHWGGYEDHLYAMYKNPEKAKEYQETLRLIIERCDEKGQRVAPGMRAEYGYCLYREGKLEEAIACFEKERETWPESVYLMNTLIASVERLKSARDSKSDAPAAQPASPASEDGPDEDDS